MQKVPGVVEGETVHHLGPAKTTWAVFGLNYEIVRAGSTENASRRQPGEASPDNDDRGTKVRKRGHLF